MMNKTDGGFQIVLIRTDGEKSLHLNFGNANRIFRLYHVGRESGSSGFQKPAGPEFPSESGRTDLSGFWIEDVQHSLWQLIHINKGNR